MSKKVVYIDVGTHLGQEYNALFTYSTLAFMWRFTKLFVASYILRRPGITCVGVAEAFAIVRNTYAIRGRRKDIVTILVEPNTRLYKHDVYLSADKVFCVALAGEDTEMGFSKLFFPNSDKVSQGASIFDSKQNIDMNDFDNVVVVGCVHFAEVLKEMLDERLGDNGYEVALRVNCEGSEDSAIYAFAKVFKSQFTTLLGSLKDVGELKGEAEMDAMMEFIDINNLQFTKFTPLYTTWKDASHSILNMLA